MAEVLLFHHVLGRTPGILAFADDLRAAGHVVHVPDLLAGRQFDSLEEGVAHVQEVGFETIIARGVAAAADLPSGIVYAGFSLGAMPAEQLAITREGARGAILFHACVPPEAFGRPWPVALPVAVHAMEADPWFVDEGDIDAARTLVAAVADGELFLYPGSSHLFAERGWPEFEPAAAALLTERVLAFLDRVG